MLTDLAGLLLVFTVGRYLAELGAGLLVMGLVGAGHALTASASSYFFGRLSDRHGRKTLIVPGILLLLATIGGCLAVPFGGPIFLVLYWLSALALGMIHPATIAWINRGEAKAHHSSAVSGNLIRFCVSWNAGFLAAQFCGGWLYPLGVRAPLCLAAVAAFVNLAVVLLTESDGRPNANPDPAVPNGHESTSAPPSASPADDPSPVFVRLSWLANLGAAFSASIILHLFAQLAVTLGVDPEQQGMIVGVMRAMVIGIYFVLHLTRFWRYRFSAYLVVQGCAVLGLGTICVANGPLALYFGVFGMAILIGFVYFSGIYYGSAGHDDDRRGLAGGMHEATLGLGVAAGALTGGVLGSLAGDRSPYVLAATVLVVLAGVQTVIIRRARRSHRPGNGQPLLGSVAAREE